MRTKITIDLVPIEELLGLNFLHVIVLIIRYCGTVAIWKTLSSQKIQSRNIKSSSKVYR